VLVFVFVALTPGHRHRCLPQSSFASRFTAGAGDPRSGDSPFTYPVRRLARRALGRNPFKSVRQTLPMYKHAEHRPHRAADKHQQRENHPPHHLRRQEQPDLRHLQLLLPKKEDRERHEPPRLPFVEATSLNLESWSFSSLAVCPRTFSARSSKGPRTRNGSRFVDLTTKGGTARVTATAPRTAQIITPFGPVSSTAKGRLHALSQQRTFSALLTNSANFFRA
jgi:hypothetical protein